MNTDALRPGQRKALKVILDRVAGAEPYTAIVQPTRYGKSDTMRVASIELYRAGIISLALALSPSDVLKRQLAGSGKWQDALKRYGIDGSGLKVGRLDIGPRDPLPTRIAPNGEMFVSTTIQLAVANAQTLAMWVESMLYQTKKPVLLLVDESHMGAKDLPYGDTINQLVKAGAQCVLFTATAMRSDNRRIIGFDYEVVASERVTVFVSKPGATPEKVLVEIYEGDKNQLRLLPHHETTFREAWAEEPLPLCKLSRIPFDVDVSRFEGGESAETLNLSGIASKSEARRALARAVRSPVVIADGAKRLIDNIKQLRRIDGKVAGIVFCGNDDDDSTTNKHAEQIKAAIGKIAPEWVCVVATSAADDGKSNGAKLIEQFMAGAGDILIVKQMASLGLDCPRMKVLLDLSTVRTPAACIQRWMRVATIYGMLQVAIIITPDDILARAVWEDLISDSCGVASTSDLEFMRSYEKSRDEQPEASWYGVNMVGDAGTQDSEMNQVGSAENDRLAFGRAMFNTFPGLQSIHTLAEVITKGAAILDMFKVKQSGDTILNTRDEIDLLRETINDLSKELTERRMAAGRYDRHEYGDVRRQAYLNAYRSANVPHGMRLEEILDLGMLRRIKHAFESMLALMERSKWR